MQNKNKVKEPELENVIGGTMEDKELVEIAPPGSDTERRAPGDISTSGKTVPGYVIQYKHK